MLLAAFCLQYFAFLRSGEFTFSRGTQGDGGLLVGDIAVGRLEAESSRNDDNAGNPSVPAQICTWGEQEML